jgi:hypothetical protein
MCEQHRKKRAGQRCLPLLFVILAAACASSDSLNAYHSASRPKATLLPTDSPHPVPPGPEPDWDAPLVNGVTVPDIQIANEALAFTGIVPKGLNSDPAIMITDPSAAPREDRSLGLVYDDPQFDRFYIVEVIPQTTQKELEYLAASCDPATGCQGSWSLVSLADEITALLIQGPVATSIVFLTPDVRIDIVGPAETLSGDEVTQIANLLA